jgi:hypothetical protein
MLSGGVRFDGMVVSLASTPISMSVEFGFSCQYLTVEAARAVETIIDWVNKTIVSTQEGKLTNNLMIYRVQVIPVSTLHVLGYLNRKHERK